MGDGGQSAAAMHVGTQMLPIGDWAHVHPTEPAGHALTQSAATAQAMGPPPMPMPRAKDASGVA